MRTVIFLSIAAAVILTLTGCGGGSLCEDESTSGVQPVKCDATMPKGCTL